MVIGIIRSELIFYAIGRSCSLVYFIVLNSAPSVDGRVNIFASSFDPIGQLEDITAFARFHLE